MVSRRVVLMGGLLTIVFGFCRTARCDELHHGCVLNEYEAKKYLSNNKIQSFSGNEEPVIKTEDKAFNKALAVALSNIARTFDVLPGFAFFDDSSGENAYATSDIKLQNDDGTVMFGLNLLKTLMSKPEHPAISVTAVCAHEFGHIVQFKHDLISLVNAGQNTVKRSELQADYLAGYYAGIKKIQTPGYKAAVFAKTQHGYGDFAVNSQSHHGTPEERANAIVAGFKLAYIEKKQFDEAIQRSIDYARGV